MLGVWLVAAALLMRAMIPTGFMPVVAGQSMVFELCTGTGPQKMLVDMESAPAKGDHAGKEMPCDFGGLSAPVLAAADALMLVVALAFVFALVFRSESDSVFTAPLRLRPQSQRPPALD